MTFEIKIQNFVYHDVLNSKTLTFDTRNVIIGWFDDVYAMNLKRGFQITHCCRSIEDN